MKRYRIVKPIILGFMGPRDQHDAIIGPEYNITLESDEHTIWTVRDNVRHESITMANAIEFWLKDGSVLEIPQKL